MVRIEGVDCEFELLSDSVVQESALGPDPEMANNALVGADVLLKIFAKCKKHDKTMAEMVKKGLSDGALVLATGQFWLALVALVMPLFAVDNAAAVQEQLEAIRKSVTDLIAKVDKDRTVSILGEINDAKNFVGFFFEHLEQGNMLECITRIENAFRHSDKAFGAALEYASEVVEQQPLNFTLLDLAIMAHMLSWFILNLAPENHLLTARDAFMKNNAKLSGLISRHTQAANAERARLIELTYFLDETPTVGDSTIDTHVYSLRDPVKNVKKVWECHAPGLATKIAYKTAVEKEKAECAEIEADRAKVQEQLVAAYDANDLGKFKVISSFLSTISFF